MIEFLLLDLDDTILDFKKAEKIALEKTLRHFGIEPTDQVCRRYSQINKDHWRMLERKELTRPQVLRGRFQVLFQELGVQADPQVCSDLYTEDLAVGHYFLPGAREAVERLSQKYRLSMVSNGNAKVQAGRLDSAGIRPFFEKIFISQELGADKPDPVFFERAFAQIPGFRKDRAMIAGDSLTSDILGGKNAGIATCWVAPQDIDPGDIRPDHRIERLSQLEGVLEGL